MKEHESKNMKNVSSYNLHKAPKFLVRNSYLMPSEADPGMWLSRSSLLRRTSKQPLGTPYSACHLVQQWVLAKGKGSLLFLGMPSQQHRCSPSKSVLGSVCTFVIWKRYSLPEKSSNLTGMDSLERSQRRKKRFFLPWLWGVYCCCFPKGIVGD